MDGDAAATDPIADCEAMASVDAGDVDRLIIAYPCRDDAWASVPLAEAASLSEWR